MLPVGFTGFSRAQHASTDLGISTLSLVMLNFVIGQARAVPPPLLAPGLGVEMYVIPFISSISSIAFICVLFSDFSQTSLRKHISVFLMLISSAKLSSLAQADRMLYNVMLGRESACTSLSSLFTTLLTALLLSPVGGGGRKPQSTGILAPASVEGGGPLQPWGSCSSPS